MPVNVPSLATTSSTLPRNQARRRIAAAALATLFVASVGVPSLASDEEPPELLAGDLASAALPAAAEPAHRGSPVPWPLQLGAFANAVGAPVADAAPDPTPRTGRAGETRGRAAREPFSMNLYSRGDFVNQKTDYWCIPASTQTMMNMMDDGRPNRSRRMQARLYRIGDRLEEDGTFDDEPEPDRYRGMGISEWVGLLNRYDYGPYELAGFKKRQNALRKAARTMRRTGKPVGLVVWRGAHAWVMSGFSATADPAVTKDFTVTSIWVHDPWYPRVSSIWGASRPPNARVSPKVLGQDFRPYGRPGRRNPERDGRYMLVLPVREGAGLSS